MDILTILTAFSFYIGWCAVNALIAQAKNRQVVLIFVLSIFLSPLLIWLYIGFVPEYIEGD